MKITKTDFEGLIIIEQDIYTDNRGSFKEVYRKDILDKNLGYSVDFCQDNHVKSNFMVLRGLHYQEEPYSQSKLVYVTKGKILDIVVDIRFNSKTYGKYFSCILSSENNKLIFIPKGFAHGYLTLSNRAFVNYKVDAYYNKDKERVISYDDPNLNIDWGVNKSEIILSNKDRYVSQFKW